MSTQDLQFRPLTVPPARWMPDACDGDTPRPVEVQQEAVVTRVVRRRWWLLLLCGIASGVGAYFVAILYGSVTAVCTGAIVYSGLPMPSGPTVYVPPKLKTYEQLLTSVATLDRIRQQRGLGMPATDLGRLIKNRAVPSSDLIDIELIWADPQSGITLLNQLMNEFIEVAFERRQETLDEYLRHVETALLKANAQVEEARQQLQQLRISRQEAFRESGLNSDQYRNLLSTISSTRTAIDEKQSRQDAVRGQLVRFDARSKLLQRTLKQALLDARMRVAMELQEPYQQQSKPWRELEQVIQELKEFIAEQPQDIDYLTWKTLLEQIGTTTLGPLDAAKTREITAAESELGELRRQQDQIEVELIPLESQVETLEQRLSAYQTETEELSLMLGGKSGLAVEEHEAQLEAAEETQRFLQLQEENIKQLKECRVRELSIAQAASDETTAVTSNRRKLFAMSFVGICCLLISPVFLIEWVGSREGFAEQTARQLGLRVMASEVLPQLEFRRGADTGQALVADESENVRMLALRIQQSIGDTGAVILFSSASRQASPVPLMGALARCLAAREERVLIVDAGDPGYARANLMSVLPLLETNESHADQDGNEGAITLATYLHEDSEHVECADLIQSTSFDRVDMIASGSEAFPREAMASNAVSRLLDYCRSKYSLILVNGPPTEQSADLQMLAARADGVVLTMNDRHGHSRESLRSVMDLLDVGAPILGVVT